MNKEFIRTDKDKTLNVLQLLELDMFKEVDRICRKYDIKYSLDGGTCLGQVRHGGFIPWDDDIDIDMTPTNFERFVEVASHELDNDKYFLRNHKNDKKYLRTNIRIELKGTKIGQRNWDKAKTNVGVFIEIFKWNYLPNNKFLRKRITSAIYYLNRIENYKMFKSTAKISRRFRGIFEIISKRTPTRLILFLDRKISNCCRNKKTNWMLDTAIIYGKHDAYPAKCIDEYEDVKFENLTVMNKKNAHDYLVIKFGDDYSKWLPPVKRISHHKWTSLKLGPYEQDYDLPENYSECFTIGYNAKKLQYMKTLTLDMAQDVHDICQENKIEYYIVGKDAVYKSLGIDERGLFWRSPLKIAMLRTAYERFKEVIADSCRYSFEDRSNDKNYKCGYGRLGLNYTYIRDMSIPLFIEDAFAHTEFFIKIIPLDNTPCDKAEQREHCKKIKRLNGLLELKWKHYNFKYFRKHNAKTKLKMILLLFTNLSKLESRLNKTREQFNDDETGFVIDSTGYELDGVAFKKDILGGGAGQELNYLGHKLMFPQYLDKFVDINRKKWTNDFLTKLKDDKENRIDYYKAKVGKIKKKTIKDIQKQYLYCYLNYFDMDEYQLTVLRYDEKNDKFLSNDEILLES